MHVPKVLTRKKTIDLIKIISKTDYCCEFICSKTFTEAKCRYSRMSHSKIKTDFVYLSYFLSFMLKAPSIHSTCLILVCRQFLIVVDSFRALSSCDSKTRLVNCSFVFHIEQSRRCSQSAIIIFLFFLQSSDIK